MDTIYIDRLLFGAMLGFLIFLPFNVIGQGLSWGLKTGITYGAPIGPPTEGAEGTLDFGPQLGGFLRYDFSPKWGVQTELYYALRRAAFSVPVVDDPFTQEQQIIVGDTTIVITVETILNGTITGTFHNTYLELPILLLYNISERWGVAGGFYVAHLVKGNHSGEVTGKIGVGGVDIDPMSFDGRPDLSPWDYGATLGGHYETPSGVQFAMRTSVGLRSVYRNTSNFTEEVIRNLYMQFTIGYRLIAKNSSRS